MSDSAQEKMAQAFQDQQLQWSSFASKALESSMKLFELNLKMTRQSLEESASSVRHLLEVKSPEQLFSIDQSQMQEKLNRIMSYANEVGAIASSFTTEISQAAQSQMSGGYEKIAKFADGAAKPVAPTAFPDLSNAQHGYEQWLDAGKKMAEAFGHSLVVPVSHTAPVKQTAPKTATKTPASRARAR